MNHLQHIKNENFLIISDQLHWKSGDCLLTNQLPNSDAEELEIERFMIQKNTIQHPMNLYLLELSTNPPQTNAAIRQGFQQSGELIQHLLEWQRETIFESVRQEFFSECPSRKKAINVLPRHREVLKYWMPLLKTKNASIYEVELSGKIHFGDTKLLQLQSCSALEIRQYAYQYWQGTKDIAPHYEFLFEGMINVSKVNNNGNAIKNSSF